MKTTQEKTTLFVFTLAAFALIGVLIIFFYTTQKVKTTNEWVDHTQEVLRKSDNVLLDVLTIETGSRGYIITGEEIYLEPVLEAENTINHNLESLEALTKDNSRQQLRVSWLKNATEERLVFTKYTIDERRNKGAKAAEKIVARGEGRKLTEKIKTIIADINAEEFRLLKERKVENANADRNTIIIFLLLVVVIIGFAIIIIKNQKKRAHLIKKEKQE